MSKVTAVTVNVPVQTYRAETRYRTTDGREFESWSNATDHQAYLDREHARKAAEAAAAARRSILDTYRSRKVTAKQDLFNALRGMETEVYSISEANLIVNAVFNHPATVDKYLRPVVDYKKQNKIKSSEV